MKTILILTTTLLAGLACAQDPYKKTGTAPAPAAAQEISSVISLREETFAIPRKDAPAFLSQFPGDMARHAELQRRVEKGEATLDRVMLLRMKSGQRSVSESMEEFRYQTTFLDPAEIKAGKMPEFETRNVGDKLDAEAVLGMDGRTVDLTLIVEATRFTGYNDGFADPKIRQPVFGTRRITTSLKLKAGDAMLIGSLNPPSDSGIAAAEKDERLHLDFITAFVGSDAPAPTSRTATLARTLVFPHVEFRDATISECVEFLQSKSRELDPEKRGLNFVIKTSPSMTGARISITFTNIPVLEAARYVAELAGLKLTVEENALVLAP